MTSNLRISVRISIMILLIAAFAAGSAQATSILYNGDFEAGTVGQIPTDWQYDDYYNYEYNGEPVLMDVSQIGDGSGGNLGVKFPNWNDDGGWNAAITQIEHLIEPGRYTYTSTFTGIGLDNDVSGGRRNFFTAKLYWTNNPSDPWGSDSSGTDNYGFLAASADEVRLTEGDNGVWQTYSVEFLIQPGDPMVGQYFAPWIRAHNYHGTLILGEVGLDHQPVPEPSTFLLLGAALVGLSRFRKRFTKGSS